VGTALLAPTPAQVVSAIAGQAIAPGSVAISGAASAAPLLSVTNSQAAPAVPFVQFNAAASGDLVVGDQVTGDSVQRMTVDSTGTHRYSPGNAAADVVQKRSGANTMQLTLGNFDLNGNNQGLAVKESANGKQGTATLVAGTATVANTSVTANSRIFLTSQADGGTPGFLRVTAKTAGVSFVVTSSNAADTSVIAYEIFEPG
jgi:hypothetical protein